MNAKRLMLVGIVLAAIGMTHHVAIAQEPPPPPPPGDRGRGGPPPMPPEKRLQAQLQEFLGAGDEEWRVLQPKIDRIQMLQQQREHLIKPRPPRPNDPNRPPPPQDDGPQSPFTDLKPDPNKTAPGGSINAQWMSLYVRLNILASNSNTSTGELRTLLDQIHDLRMKSDAELAQARAELRELVTAQQEAVLTIVGILD